MTLAAYMIQEADGFKWINRGGGTDDYLAITGHESALRPFVELLIQPDKAYVNVGAHVGLWAVRMAFKAKFTFAIEANFNTFEALERNIEINQLNKRVQAICAAVWDESDVKVSFKDEKGFESGGSNRVVVADTGTMPTRTLDELFPKDASLSIGLIQMDTEGAEARILRGGERILAEERPNLLIELHEGHPGTDPDLRAQVYDVLDRQGYWYQSLHVAGSEEHLMAKPNESIQEFPEAVRSGT